MRITPLDVRKQEFRRTVRGLDADEVHGFLATVADEYEAVLTDNKQLRDRVIDLDHKISEYRNMEKTLRDTLLTAERVMAEARQNARKEAELILRDAQVKASAQTSDISRQVESLRAQLRELRGHRDSFLARMNSLCEAQAGLVESYRKDFENEDRQVERRPAPAAPAAAAPPKTAPAEERAPVSRPLPPVGDDRWRDYSVRAQSRPVAPVTPDIDLDPEDEIDQEVDAVFSTAPKTVPAPVSPAPPAVATRFAPDSEDAVDRAVEAIEAYDLPPTSAYDGLDAYPASGPSAPPPYPTRSDFSGAHASLPDAVDSAADEPHRVEEGEPSASGSRWSLSRFTRGLASF